MTLQLGDNASRAALARSSRFRECVYSDRLAIEVEFGLRPGSSDCVSRFSGDGVSPYTKILRQHLKWQQIDSRQPMRKAGGLTKHLQEEPEAGVLCSV